MAQQRGTRGEGSVIPVRDRKTGETRYRIKIPVRDIFDRPRPPKTKLMPRGTTKAAAHREKRRMLQERDAGKIQHTSLESVGSLLERWLDTLAATGAQNTHRTYRQLAERYLVPTLGQIPLAKLERKQVRAVLEQIIRDGKQPTAAGVQSALVRALDLAVDEELVVENVARLVRRSTVIRNIGAVAHRAALKRVPPAAEVAQLLAHLEPHPHGLIVAVLAMTGMRLAEALGSAYPALDWDAGTLHVTQNCTYDQGMFQIGPTKTGEARLIVLDDDLLTRLTRWETRTLPMRMAGGCGRWLQAQPFVQVRPGFPRLSTDLIFIRADGRPILPTSIRRTMLRGCAALGIPPIHPHELRHFVDTQLAKAQVDPATRRGWLGHESAAMDKIYVHTDLPRLREAGQIIRELLVGRR